VLGGAGHVAGRVDQRIGRRLERVHVDGSGRGGVDTGRSQIQPVGTGVAAGGDQQPFAGEATTGAGDDDRPVRSGQDLDGSVLDHRDAIVGEHLP
jgi:hypothetical protein